MVSRTPSVGRSIASRAGPPAPAPGRRPRTRRRVRRATPAGSRVPKVCQGSTVLTTAEAGRSAAPVATAVTRPSATRSAVTGLFRWTSTRRRSSRPARTSTRSEDRPGSPEVGSWAGWTCHRPKVRCTESSTAAQAGVLSGVPPSRWATLRTSASRCGCPTSRANPATVRRPSRSRRTARVRSASRRSASQPRGRSVCQTRSSRSTRSRQRTATDSPYAAESAACWAPRSVGQTSSRPSANTTTGGSAGTSAYFWRASSASSGRPLLRNRSRHGAGKPSTAGAASTSGPDGRATAAHRPPSRSARSCSSTGYPDLASRAAAAIPARPPPTTTTGSVTPAAAGAGAASPAAPAHSDDEPDPDQQDGRPPQPPGSTDGRGP